MATLAGAALGGWLGESLGLRPTLVVGGAILIVAALVLLPARRAGVQPLPAGD
jgi:predicted MFS family arabinose efflux permease